MADAAPHLVANEAAEPRESSGQGAWTGEDLAHLRLRAQPGGVASQRVVLLGAHDDLRVDPGELVDELEVLVREGAVLPAV